MSSVLFLLCGVPGSGKTWVCEQVRDKFRYLSHDEHTHGTLCELAIKPSGKPTLIDCPFAERALRGKLEDAGMQVIPLFIVEHPDVVTSRYFSREKRMPAPNVRARAVSIMNKVREWDAPHGTSSEMLEYLKRV